MRKMMVSTQVYHLCHPDHHGKKTHQMTNQRVKLTILPHNIWNSPLTWTPHLNGMLLIYNREESSVRHVWTNSDPLLKDGMTKG
jgi:SUMO ligase MMS21 Smc5/6 complex component